MGNLYYKGYKLNNNYDSLNEEEKKVLFACVWMVSYGATIRETGENCGYSTTTLWRRIHNSCKGLSTELYKDVCKQMKKNLAVRNYRNARKKHKRKIWR